MGTAASVSLLLLGYVLGPVALVWGWVWWGMRPKKWTVSSILSLVGFVLATASAVLAISSVGYAQVHHFEYFDPLLARIIRWGCLLSMAGFVFAVGGVWRRNTLRWFAVASAVGTFAFWFLSAVAED
jgi:hypothetical protein